MPPAGRYPIGGLIMGPRLARARLMRKAQCATAFEAEVVIARRPIFQLIDQWSIEVLGLIQAEIVSSLVISRYLSAGIST